LSFIVKNRESVVLLLEKLGLDEEEFYRAVRYNDHHMGSIAALRGLWMEDGNKFAKVFRILSKQYLRKHSLSYIFNSRISCLLKHMKYRNKI
jgi:hypothetical protein